MIHNALHDLVRLRSNDAGQTLIIYPTDNDGREHAPPVMSPELIAKIGQGKRAQCRQAGSTKKIQKNIKKTEVVACWCMLL